MDDTTRANGYKHGRPEGRDVKPADEIVRKVIEALPAETRLYPDVYAWQVTDALEAATVAPAVDREALIERVDGSALDHFLKSFSGDEAGDIDYVWAEDGNTGWAMRGGNDVASVLLKAFDALLASGVLRDVRDVRDVQAEALEQAAAARPPAPAGRYELAVWLRERAQAIREARNERD